MSSFAQKTHWDSSLYRNGQLKYKGLYLEHSAIDNFQYGRWDYWYEDGKKQLEIWVDTVKDYYINMWLVDGQQILKNGNGFYYETELGLDNIDSLVYQIQDSIKKGDFKRYRSFKNKSYYLVTVGQYEDAKKTGVWHYEDTVSKIFFLRTYKNGEQNGVEINYFPNGKVKDSVNYQNGERNGNYKSYSEKNTLLTDCNYKNGCLTDKYIEYFPNGVIKLYGQYSQNKGYIKTDIIGISLTGVNKRSTMNLLVENKPLKQGVWKYFNTRGQLVKKEKYLNDKRIY